MDCPVVYQPQLEGLQVVHGSPFELIIAPTVLDIQVLIPEVLVVEVSNLSQIIVNYEVSETKDILPILSAGQSSFFLSYSPTTPQMSKLFFNGQKVRYGVDYNITNGNQVVWLGAQVLDVIDELEIYYY
jgi:hypothetical protein